MPYAENHKNGESMAFEQVNHLLRQYANRPTPLYEAQQLSAKLNVSVWLKREDLASTGSLQINQALAQVYSARCEHKKMVVAETGSGMHGVAVATACKIFQLPCTIFMGIKDMKRQALNVTKMKVLGARLVEVDTGTQTVKDALDALLEYMAKNDQDIFWAPASAYGPQAGMIAALQSVVGREARQQMLELTNGLPTYVMAGGGREVSGIAMFQAFLPDRLIKLVAAQPTGRGLNTNKTSAALLSGYRGNLHLTDTLVLMNEKGEVAASHCIAPGLDYPAALSQHVEWKTQGLVDYVAVNDYEAIEAAYMLMDTEGIVPSLESAHALALLRKVSFQRNDKVVVCIGGSGEKDLPKYEAYQEVMS